YYFDQGGNLNAIRWNDWKLNFAVMEGNIATGERKVTAWAGIENLRMDPYERGLEDGGGAIEVLARNMWSIVPVQAKLKEFFADFDKYPYQEGSSERRRHQLRADASAGRDEAVEGPGALVAAVAGRWRTH